MDAELHEHLLSQARNGDRAAMGQLLEAFRPYLTLHAQRRFDPRLQSRVDPTDLVQHFFESVAVHAGLTLHAKVEGRNDHHKAEALFKALGRALRTAVSLDPRREGIPSTKGTL